MTINEAKNKLVAWCLAQVGYAEGASDAHGVIITYVCA